MNMSFLMAADQTVVCVHGFMRGRGNFTKLARVFEKKGHHVFNWSYPSRKKYIEEHGEALVQELKRLAQETPGKPISFVTHSMGGLVLRSALNHPECPEEAKNGRAVLIAPPNQGSILARRLWNLKLLRWIMGDKSGKQLREVPSGHFPDEMPVLVIAGRAGFNFLIPGKNDGKVSVEETRLSTPHEHVTVWAGHSWICSSPSVIHRALSFVE